MVPLDQRRAAEQGYVASVLGSGTARLICVTPRRRGFRAERWSHWHPKGGADRVGFRGDHPAAPGGTRGCLPRRPGLFGRPLLPALPLRERVATREVEEAAIIHPAMGEVGAVGLPDPVNGTKRALVEWREPPPALPVTRSGKMLPGALRRALVGEDPGNLVTAAFPGVCQAVPVL